MTSKRLRTKSKGPAAVAQAKTVKKLPPQVLLLFMQELAKQHRLGTLLEMALASKATHDLAFPVINDFPRCHLWLVVEHECPWNGAQGDVVLGVHKTLKSACDVIREELDMDWEDTWDFSKCPYIKASDDTLAVINKVSKVKPFLVYGRVDQGSTVYVKLAGRNFLKNFEGFEDEEFAPDFGPMVIEGVFVDKKQAKRHRIPGKREFCEMCCYGQPCNAKPEFYKTKSYQVEDREVTEEFGRDADDYF